MLSRRSWEGTTTYGREPVRASTVSARRTCSGFDQKPPRPKVATPTSLDRVAVAGPQLELAAVVTAEDATGRLVERTRPRPALQPPRGAAHGRRRVRRCPGETLWPVAHAAAAARYAATSA